MNDAIDATPNAPVEREAIARTAQGFWQGPSGRTWEDCCEKLPPQADWFRRLADAILAVRLDEAVIRKDEREKAIHEADQFVGALWSDLFNKDMVKAAGAYFFDKWRAQIRAIAIRNGGKQP